MNYLSGSIPPVALAGAVATGDVGTMFTIASIFAIVSGFAIVFTITLKSKEKYKINKRI